MRSVFVVLSMPMYLVKEVEPHAWDAFLLTQPYTLFTQSSAYARFYRSLGEQTWMFGVYKGEQLIGGALVVSTHAKRGNFLYLPYGPVFSPQHKLAFSVFVEHLKAFGKKEGYQFIRVSPFIEDTPDIRLQFKDAGFHTAPMHILAERTWLLDIRPSEEELLRHMNKNHRNLIRRCEREGVRVVMRTDVEAVKLLHTLLGNTAERHKFIPFSESYIEKEFAAMIEKGEAVVFLGYLPDGRLDAAAIIMFHGTMAAYRHSASLNLDKHLPTSYLIQWKVIEEAKRRGLIWYNFWGIAPEGATPHHPFYGITHFKKGFGGELRELLHCQDIALSWQYSLNWIVETARRLYRGF